MKLFPGWPINAAFVYMPRWKKFCVSKMLGNQRHEKNRPKKPMQTYFYKHSAFNCNFPVFLKIVWSEWNSEPEPFKPKDVPWIVLSLATTRNSLSMFLGDHLNTVTPEAAIFASTKQRLKTYCFDFFLKTFHEEFLSTFSNLGFWETTCVLFVSSGAVKRPSFRRAKKLCKETFIQTSNLIRFSYESFQLLSTKLPLPLNLAIL